MGTPAEGPTAGRALVEVYGSGFRLPPAFPASSGPSGPAQAGLVRVGVQKTVSVTFDGAEAPLVEVVRSNLLRVLTPVSPIPAVSATGHGAGTVDVVVRNLDDAGVPIPGEEVTLADGYAYRRPKLDAATESDFLRLVRAFLREWKRQVLPDVVLTDHTDFDPDVSTAFVEVAALPAIVLSLTGIPENRFYSLNEGPEEEINEDRVDVRRRPRTVDLNFDVIGISASTMEMTNLLAAANEFMRRNPFLDLDRDPADPGKGRVSYELDFQPGASFEVGNRPNNSNLRSFSGAVVVRGFDFEGFTGFPADEIRAMSATLKDPVRLDAERSSG